MENKVPAPAAGGSQAVARLPRPRLKFVNYDRIPFKIWSGLAFSFAVGWLFSYAILDPRKEKTKTFWKNYHVNLDYERMKKAGVFSCVNPDGEIQTGW